MITFKEYSSLAESEDLEKYMRTDEFSMYKSSIKSEYKGLRERFPFKGGKLYRGLNFKTPLEYLHFMRKARSGYYEDKSVSSWATSQNEASSYAAAPMVFNISREVATMSEKMHKEYERIMGFIGVIIEVNVKNEGIDTSLAPYPGEGEIILPPGRFKIVNTHFEKKYKHLMKNVDINAEVLEELNKPNIDYDRMKALFHNKGNDLLDSTKKGIVDFTMKKVFDSKLVHLELEKSDGGIWGNNSADFGLLFPKEAKNKKHQVLYANVFGSIMIEFLDLDEVQSLISDKDKRRLKDVVNEVTKNLDSGYSLKMPHGRIFKILSARYGIEVSELPHVRKYYKEIYDNFNNVLRYKGNELQNLHKFIADFTEAFKGLL